MVIIQSSRFRAKIVSGPRWLRMDFGTMFVIVIGIVMVIVNVFVIVIMTVVLCNGNCNCNCDRNRNCNRDWALQFYFVVVMAGM